MNRGCGAALAVLLPSAIRPRDRPLRVCVGVVKLVTVIVRKCLCGGHVAG